jgi:hypothetical protein
MGLVVVLALAVGASIGAASASASYFTAGQYPATLKSSAFSEQKLELAGGNTYRCGGLGSEATLSGYAEALTPSYSEGAASCTGPELFDAKGTWTMNGCKFIFHAGTETSPGNFGGTAEIGPSGCGPIVLKGNTCTKKLAAQSGIPASFKDEGSGSTASFKASISNAAVTYTPEGPAWTCGSGTLTAYYTASWQMSGYNAGGEAVGAAVAKQPPIGVYLAGKEGSEPRFEAEKYPATVNGAQNPANKYKLELEGNRTLSCESAVLQGTLSASATQLGLVPSYQSCSMTILGNQDPATVQANSCQYSLNALNVGPPYAGSLGVACSKEGDGIEIKAYASAQKQAEGIPLCAFTVAPQSALKGVSLENVVSGISKGIGVSFGVTGIAYTKTQGTVTNCGAKAGTTAGLTGTGTLLGQL